MATLLIMLPTPQSINTLILSDIHLGLEVTRVKECQELINSYKSGKKYNFNRLILLGDTFNSMNLDLLRPWEWDFVNNLRLIAKPETEVEVVWITGNHDERLADLMTKMMDAKIYHQYQWQIADVKCFAIHGHQFDKWVRDYVLLSKIGYWFYDHIQKIDGPKHTFSRWLKEFSKKTLKVNDEISAGVATYLKQNKIQVDAVFCGHTHLEDKKCFNGGKICYYNSGCWTGLHAPSYITIDNQGKIEVREYDKNP